MSKHGLRLDIFALGFASLFTVVACQNTVTSNSKSFDDSVTPAPAAALKVQAAPAHVAAECPAFAGKYSDGGRETAILQETAENGATYVFSDGRMIIADGEMHLGPDGADTSYVAQCKDGELKVAMKPSVKSEKNESMTIVFKAFTGDGDIKLLMSSSDGKSEETIMANMNRPLPRAKHSAEACPALKGEYLDGSSTISIQMTSRKTGPTYQIQNESFVADGKVHAANGRGEYDTYAATCHADTVKVYFGKRGGVARMTSFTLLENGDVEGESLSSSRSGGREKATLKRVLEPAAAPAVAPSPASED